MRTVTKFHRTRQRILDKHNEEYNQLIATHLHMNSDIYYLSTETREIEIDGETIEIYLNPQGLRIIVMTKMDTNRALP